MSIAGVSCVIGATMATAQDSPTGDMKRGEQFFQTSCALCHSTRLGEGNTLVIKQGPTLVGVMERKAGTSPHFGFTEALMESGLVWNTESLHRYLTSPMTAVPGTTMPMPVPDAGTRADLIAYLATLKTPAGVDLAGKAIVPEVLEQAHSASLQMTFYTATNGTAAFPQEYQGDAFVALHGSWNRATRTGYKLARIHLNDGVPTGQYVDFLTGFVVDDRSVWGRPVGVAVAHDGALLMTEDGRGTIWRIAYTGR